jgi:hypothetical protein
MDGTPLTEVFTDKDVLINDTPRPPYRTILYCFGSASDALANQIVEAIAVRLVCA